MSVPQIQSAFSAGEISPELYGEVDLKKISAAATTMRNAVVSYRGGAMSRGGLALVGVCKQTVSGTGPPRIIPFQFSITQGYVLEFGDNYLRFIFQGGYVLAGGGGIYEISTPYAAVDLPYLKFAQSADVMSLTCSNPVTGTEYAPYDLTRVGNNNWTLVATSFTAQIAAPTGLTATAQSSDIPSTYYGYCVTAVNGTTGEESVASATVSVQNNDIAISAGTNTISWKAVTGAGSYNVYKSTPSYGGLVPVGAIYGFMSSALGTSAIDTNITPDFQQSPPLHSNPFAPGAILGVVPTAGGTNYSQQTGSYTITTSTGAGFAGAPVFVGGALAGFYISNPGYGYVSGNTIAFSDSGGGLAYGTFTYSGANDTDGDKASFNSTSIEFKGSPAQSGTIVSGELYSEIGSTNALTAQILANTLSNYNSPNTNCATYSANNVTITITYKTPGTVGNAYTLNAASSHAVASGTTLSGGGTVGSGATATLTVGPQSGTYPGVVSYFQQRCFYANSFNDPDTFWASRPGAYKNFDGGIPVNPTDAITASPWTEQVNGIQWLIPMPGGLIAMTGNRAWQIIGEGSYQLNVAPVTPSTTQAQPQAFNGCSATIPPIVIDYDVLYVQAVGDTTVRDLAWNFWVNIYTGNDLTILSSHLFLYRQLVQWAWCREPYKVLWATRDDGTMLSLTFLKEQEVYGWARHDTQGLVVSLTSVIEPPVNALYAVVERFTTSAPNGIYCLERMDNRVWQSVEDTYAVDSGVSNPMSSPNAFLYASSPSGTGVTFTAGSSVFTAGSIGQIIRMGGGIARVTGYTSGGQVTGNWVLAASNGAIGLPYASAGNWTIAAPITTIQAAHLANMTGLAGLADGVPLTGLTADGSGNIALPFPASNVKVGLPFTAQIQTPYLNGGGEPTLQGRRKVIPAATVRLAASGQFQYGTNQPDGAAQNPPQNAPAWSNMATGDPTKPTGGQDPAVTYTSPGGHSVTQLWTGDLRVVGNGSEWNSKGQVAVQQTLPLPLEITALMPEGLPGDTPENTYQPKQEQQQGQARGPGRWMLQGGPRI